MSTSATQTGTTTRAGRSGKGLGFAAAALAIVIAVGFVFTINQGSDGATVIRRAPVSATERAAQIASDRWDEMITMNEAAYAQQLRPRVDYNAEIDRLSAMAAEVTAVKSPGSNEIERLNAMAAEVAAVKSPGSNPELYKLTHSIQLGAQEPTELNQPEWDNRIP
jgi:hypothetical protein